MKAKSVYLNICLILVLGGLPVAGFAQESEIIKSHEAAYTDTDLLQGKWVLENVSAFDENMKTMPFSIDSICCQEISTEIDIQRDEVTFTFESGEHKVEYERAVRKSAFYFPFYAGWKIVDNKLQLSWGQDVEISAGTIIQTIVLTYKLK